MLIKGKIAGVGTNSLMVIIPKATCEEMNLKIKDTVLIDITKITEDGK